MALESPTYMQLYARAVELAKRAGGPHSVTPAVLKEVSEADVAPVLEEKLLAACQENLSQLEPLPKLVLCLQFLRWLPDSPSPGSWSYFARVAIEALHDLGRLELMPLRITLLDRLLASSPLPEDRADFLFRRGNTRLTLLLEDPSQREAALGDLRAAVELSRMTGHSVAELHGECTLARAEFLGLPGRSPSSFEAIQQRVAHLETLLPRAKPLDLKGNVQDILSELHLRCVQLGHTSSSAQAIYHARQAASLTATPELKATRWATLAQLMLLHGTPEEQASAVQAAREAVDVLPPGTGNAYATLPLGVLGLALLRNGQSADAISYLEQALVMLARQRPSTNRNLFRLNLAKALLEQNRPGDARLHAELALTDARTLRDKESMLDATRLLVTMDRENGHTANALQRLRQAEAELAGTAAQTWLALERLRPSLGDAPSADFVELIRRVLSGQLPTNRDSVAHLQAVVSNHAHALPSDIRRQFLQDDRRHLLRNEVLRARLLDAEGRRQEALDLLRSILERESKPGKQLSAAALLMALLPEDAREERLRRCDTVEALLEDSTRDSPYIRTDLSIALWRCGRTDPGLLERAWRHASLAASKLEGPPSALTSNARSRARIRLDQLSLRSQQSSTAVLECATWFTQELPLPEMELSGYRLHAVKCLLAHGPLAHPEALVLARKLLRLVSQNDEARALTARLRWIHARQTSQPFSYPASSAQLEGPFDEVPAFAVALAQGEHPRLVGPLEFDGIRATLAVVQARPEREEMVLAWLFELDPSQRALEALMDEVATASQNALFSRLRELVEKAASEKPSFRLLRLRVTLCRKQVKSGATAPYEEAADALLAFAQTDEERIAAREIKAIERMDSGQMESARQFLSEAMEEARRVSLEPQGMFSLLVSLGNAFRRGKEPDLERTLAFYAEAESMKPPNPHAAARLWTVKANCLLERQAEGDTAQALSLLELALGVRTDGFLRVETLLLAAHAEQQLPGRNESPGLRRALARLDEAERHAEGSYQLMVAKEQVAILAQLIHLHPAERGFHQRLEVLRQRHPELAKDIHRASGGLAGPVPKELAESVGDMFSDPAGMAFYDALRGLTMPDLDMEEEMARGMGHDPTEVRQVIEQIYQREDRSPQALRRRADRLAQIVDPQARPGAAVGRARLLTLLIEHDLAQPQETERAANEAEQLVRQMPDSKVKLTLLLELASVWAPEAHYHHPVQDFRRAAELSAEVRAASPPGTELSRMALQRMARATRYRTDGDISAHLSEAERLYEECAKEYDAVGMKDVAAHTRSNLTEVRVSRRTGNHLADLKEGIAASTTLIAEGGPADQQARARVRRAIDMTLSGAARTDPQGDAELAAALKEFESVDRSLLSTPDRYSADNYQTICSAELAYRARKHPEAIALWRARFSSLDPQVPPEVRAYTIHNMADMIMRPGAPLPQVMEALQLSEQILGVRTLEQYPDHHWETCDNIGRTTAMLLLNPPNGQPWSASEGQDLWARGERALRGALAAARRIGSHQRLMQSATELLLLALSAPSVAQLETAAEEGWRAADEARPYLLLDEQAALEEAHCGAEIALTLAHMLSAGGVVMASTGVKFALARDRAMRVLRWVTRAVGAAQRRLAGRTARPESVPHKKWVDWLSAIRSGDTRRIERTLDAMRRDAPLFLRGEPDLTGTWRWLETRPGAVAVTVLTGQHGTMAAILTHDTKPRALIVGLETSPPPYDEDTVARSLTTSGPSQEYAAVLAWARREILPPLQGLLPSNPSRILWVPTGDLRVLAPADLWPGVPVTCAARLDLETRSLPERPRRTLLAVADPGPDTKLSIPGSIEMGAQLARQAEGVGLLRVRMSRGKAWGQALGVDCPGLVDGPATPEDILRELAEVDLALLLCHGKVEGPQSAQLFLVNGAGATVPLELEQLAADPQRVAGATIVLLSCETGRVGDWLHQAAGLAGALLACGARSVIAPLWDVLLGPARVVGEAMLRALADREDVSMALHRLHSPEEGVPLGLVNPAQKEREKAWSLKAFVHWAG